MQAQLKTFGLLAALLTSALLGACGPATPPVETPPAPTSAPETPAMPSAEPGTAPTAAPTAAPSAAPSAGPKEAPPAAASQPVGPSALLADVKAAGVDLTKASSLDKLPAAQKKKLMPLFVKALGYAGCTGCHAKEGDFKTETRNMKIAEEMFDHFVAGLRDDKGGAIFCDSCHAGKAKPLSRADQGALKKFMDTDYVQKLARADKKDHECATCHGEALETKIIDKLWKVK